MGKKIDTIEKVILVGTAALSLYHIYKSLKNELMKPKEEIIPEVKEEKESEPEVKEKEPEINVYKIDLNQPTSASTFTAYNHTYAKSEVVNELVATVKDHGKRIDEMNKVIEKILETITTSHITIEENHDSNKVTRIPSDLEETGPFSYYESYRFGKKLEEAMKDNEEE